jgi:hypothetical protein
MFALTWESLSIINCTNGKTANVFASDMYEALLMKRKLNLTKCNAQVMLLNLNPDRCTNEQLPICVNGISNYAVVDPSARSDCSAQSVRDEIIELNPCEGEPRMGWKNCTKMLCSIRRC